MRIESSGFDKLLRKLEGIENKVPKATKEILTEGGEILTTETRQAIRKAANRGYATGALERSVAPTNPKTNIYGSFVAVRPTGSDSKGMRNGEKWGYLLHGNGKGSEPRDFVSEAVGKAEGKIARTAEEIIEKYLEE